MTNSRSQRLKWIRGKQRGTWWAHTTIRPYCFLIMETVPLKDPNWSCQSEMRYDVSLNKGTAFHVHIGRYGSLAYAKRKVKEWYKSGKLAEYCND